MRGEWCEWYAVLALLASSIRLGQSLWANASRHSSEADATKSSPVLELRRHL